MYTCNVCQRLLSHDQFYKDKRRPTGHRSSCKECDRTKVDRSGANRRARAHYARNREAMREASRSWKRANAERVAQYNQRYEAEKADVRARLNLERRHTVRQATPPWYDEAKVRVIYAHSRAISRSSGVEHHVDHIIPLTNPFVCGLHVQENLQILPALDNRKKHNYFDQSMS